MDKKTKNQLIIIHIIFFVGLLVSWTIYLAVFAVPFYLVASIWLIFKDVSLRSKLLTIFIYLILSFPVIAWTAWLFDIRL